MNSPNQDLQSNLQTELYKRSISKTAEKHSRVADGFSERRYYANPTEYFKRRVDLIRSWGTELSPGDSILELGCGDGLLGSLLAKEGFKYTGIDISEGMIEAAKARALRLGVQAEFRLGDMHELDFDEDQYDAIVMLEVFQYAVDPEFLLKALRPLVRKKLIIDWKHSMESLAQRRWKDNRSISLRDVCEMLERAGFGQVDWHPVFIPSKTRLPPLFISALARLESVPWLRSAIIQRKFWAIVKGETTQ